MARSDFPRQRAIAGSLKVGLTSAAVAASLAGWAALSATPARESAVPQTLTAGSAQDRGQAPAQQAPAIPFTGPRAERLPYRENGHRHGEWDGHGDARPMRGEHGDERPLWGQPETQPAPDTVLPETQPAPDTVLPETQPAPDTVLPETQRAPNTTLPQIQQQPRTGGPITGTRSSS